MEKKKSKPVKKRVPPPKPLAPKRQIIKARPSVISELYEMEPALLKKGWKKISEEEKGQDIVITYHRGEASRFVITCEPLHITWRKFTLSKKDGTMLRRSLVLGVIHYDIKKEEYLNYI